MPIQIETEWWRLNSGFLGSCSGSYTRAPSCSAPLTHSAGDPHFGRHRKIQHRKAGRVQIDDECFVGVGLRVAFAPIEHGEHRRLESTLCPAWCLKPGYAVYRYCQLKKRRGVDYYLHAWCFVIRSPTFLSAPRSD